MSVTRTFTVTVVSTGSGNKYFIDGVQQATINIAEGGTYKFDVSDSSVSGHPFKFSTTSNGTHGGGSEYTTGVTTSGTAGQSDAYVQIVVAASAPTLYYYCQYHSGMGGQANTPTSNTWGVFPWNVNQYGDQNSVDNTLTGLSTTSSVGSLEAFNEEGWGRQEWGNSGWGVEYAVSLSGQSTTSTVGSVTAFDTTTVTLTGLSTTSNVGTPTFVGLTVADLTGVQATTELGDFDNAGTLVGWGRNGWGEEPYGDSFNKLVQLAGSSALTMTSSTGSLTVTPEELIEVTGVSATSSTGSLTPVIDSLIVPTGLSAISNVGVPIATEATVGLTGLSTTATVGGIILDALTVELDGLSTTSSVGLLQEQISQVLTGQQATSSVGSLTIEIGIPLTGVISTSATGTISPTPMTIGLTGQEAISSVNASGISLPGVYEILTPKTSTGYTTKTPKTSTGYTIKTPA